MPHLLLITDQHFPDIMASGTEIPLAISVLFKTPKCTENFNCIQIDLYRDGFSDCREVWYLGINSMGFSKPINFGRKPNVFGIKSRVCIHDNFGKPSPQFFFKIFYFLNT